jgi:hypothetical protein
VGQLRCLCCRPAWVHSHARMMCVLRFGLSAGPHSGCGLQQVGVSCRQSLAVKVMRLLTVSRAACMVEYGVECEHRCVWKCIRAGHGLHPLLTKHCHCS